MVTAATRGSALAPTRVDHADAPQSDRDFARRRDLRAFLMACRARLRPSDVDLPERGRRRVAGLRRDEVAELIGVSADWYRWLESGRDVRVSPQLVARIAKALRLTASEELRIYALALPELYEAALRFGGTMPTALESWPRRPRHASVWRRVERADALSA